MFGRICLVSNAGGSITIGTGTVSATTGTSTISNSAAGTISIAGGTLNGIGGITNTGASSQISGFGTLTGAVPDLTPTTYMVALKPGSDVDAYVRRLAAAQPDLLDVQVASTGNTAFLAAALLVAVTPGPGIFYVAARTLAGGRAEGLASSFGTGVGGLFHVLAGAIGISAIVMTSAEAFTALKLVGAFYLIWLGVKTWREARIVVPVDVETTGARKAFREGILVEAFNPKTAAFFLAFIPQFVDPNANVTQQFLVLGLISVALNTAVDVVVTYWAAKARAGLSPTAHTSVQSLPRCQTC